MHRRCDRIRTPRMRVATAEGGGWCENEAVTFWEQLWAEIGVTPAHAVGVVVASTVLYLTFTMVLRVWGQRLFANRSGTGLAVVMALGAIVGRSMLGPNATLLGGLICLATLLVLESFFGSGRRAGLIGHRRAVLIYSEGGIDRRLLARYHINERVVWTRLRQAGITRLDDVRAIVLETDGSLSILPAGSDLDPRLLSNVRGGEKLLGED